MGALILYSVPGTASTVACAALEETEVPYETVEVERHNRDNPPEFKLVNPHGRVPALRDGDVRLYETAAIILHLGDRFPESPLAPPVGSAERPDYYRWLAYLTNTLHTAYTRWYAPWYMPDQPELAQSIRGAGAEQIGDSLDFIDAHLAVRPYLVGERFTGADLLLHMLSSPNWSLDLMPPAFSRRHVADHHERIDTRSAVARMKAIHGLDWTAT
jgi:glutathione S-transferase